MTHNEKCEHPRTPENSRHDGQRWRCLECLRIRSRRRYYRLKGVRLTAAQFAQTGRKKAPLITDDAIAEVAYVIQTQPRA